MGEEMLLEIAPGVFGGIRAYFGGHSTVGQSLAWTAARDALLRSMEPLSMTTALAFWRGG